MYDATLFGLFVLLVVGGVGAPLPEDLTLLGFGALAHQHVLRLRNVILVGFLGVVSADWIIYLAGRYFGADLVAHPFLARLFQASRIDAVRQAVQRHGTRAVFFARFVFGFRIVTFLAAGAFHVPPLKFAVGEAAGSAIFVPAMATLGFLFADRAEHLAQNVSHVQHWLELAGVVGVLLYLVLRGWAARTGLGGDEG